MRRKSVNSDSAPLRAGAQHNLESHEHSGGSLGWVSRMPNCSVPRRQLRRSTLAPVIVFFGSSSHAWAQGTHDWGMWFCTLVVIGALAALVFFLITVVRWLMR